MKVLGIDVGGSGIKGALVDIEKGELATSRIRHSTPRPAKPQAVIQVIKQLVEEFEYQGPLGVGFPAVVLDGQVLSAANIDDGWIDFAGQQAIQEATGCDTLLLNDADAAGLAEARFGAGHGRKGLIMVLTLGTGIGSALFINGRLVPNTELGHLYLGGHKKDAEEYASDRIRSKQDLKWKVWAKRLDEYFHHLEGLFSPNLFIVGGGVSKKHRKFIPRLTVRTPVIPAELRNEAGIIGAALAVAGQ